MKCWHPAVTCHEIAGTNLYAHEMLAQYHCSFCGDSVCESLYDY